MIRNAQDRPIQLAIHGAAGRMGRRLIALAQEDKQLKLVGAIDMPGHPLAGQDAGVIAGVGAVNVKLADRLPMDPRPDVVIDFSLPGAFRNILKACVEAHCPLVVGTTGLTPQDHAALDDAGRSIAVLQAPNMSLGVNLMLGLVAQVAQTLGDDYDIEITEAHHRFKKDAPSGTALAIARSICDATGKSLEKDVVHGRKGDDVPRRRGQIGMHALRMGDVVGEHTAAFAALGERLEITHIATTRDVFAQGALTAAKWLADRPAGRYGMKDVLGLK